MKKIMVLAALLLMQQGCEKTSKTERIAQSVNLTSSVIFVRHPSGIVFAVSSPEWSGEYQKHQTNPQLLMTIVPKDQVPLLENQIIDQDKFADEETDQNN